MAPLTNNFSVCSRFSCLQDVIIRLDSKVKTISFTYDIKETNLESCNLTPDMECLNTL